MFENIIIMSSNLKFCFGRLFWICLLLVCMRLSTSNDIIEEFQVSDPMGLHQSSIDYFIERHKEDKNETMDADSHMMKRAKTHAIRRLVRRSDEELRLVSPNQENAALNIDGTAAIGSVSESRQLKLPSPADPKDGILTATINAQTSKALIVESGLANANALAFNENVGIGALATAGALPTGAQGEWIELAESKLKREAQLSHHELLWELGSELIEQEQIQRGGLNVTSEEALLTTLVQWVEKNGGKTNYIKPRVTKTGFSLDALEDIERGEAVVKIPFKLIMCRQTARNVAIGQSGRYLGEELGKTFDENEVWGLSIFLLHEYYKEINGNGSKWGPFLRTLRMRFLSTQAVMALKGTVAAGLSNEWTKSADQFLWWSIGADGPCVPTVKICVTKPNDRAGGELRYNLHQIRWAYWVVKQNAVRVRQVSTGLDFLALVPFFPMAEKHIPCDLVTPDLLSSSAQRGAAVSSGVKFELDGTVTIRSSVLTKSGAAVQVEPGKFTDSEFYMRFLSMPSTEPNLNNYIHLKLPGAIPKGSRFHLCLKGTDKQKSSDQCQGSYRSESMFWKSKVLSEWRKVMNLPPRLSELRMWATRLHLYGVGEEAKLQNAANHLIAGLPLPLDDMPAEEQLMLMGVARSPDEAALMVSGNEQPSIPQLYSAPDATEDWEAKRSMEELAYLAAQAQNSIGVGNDFLNATQAVLNRTRDFFQHGVLPMGGLDELDQVLLKKIGMLAHCGFENDMKITHGNISQELMCAMRVHLLNESEIAVFCPADARFWQDNCHDVQFMNFTAISSNNEALVMNAFRTSVQGLLSGYPTSREEDKVMLAAGGMGSVLRGAIQLRMREKEMLYSILDFITEHELACSNGSVVFQLEEKVKQRLEADERQAEHARFKEKIQIMASTSDQIPLAVVSVDFGRDRKENLTLHEGQDLDFAVNAFIRLHSLPATNAPNLQRALKERVQNPDPLLLTLGVVVPTGHRRILSVPTGSNASLEVGVFCARNNVTSLKSCQQIESRVMARLECSFVRTVLLNLPIDAPDSRKLKFLIRQGEQHDVRQLASDFLELYKMSLDNTDAIATEANKRLPPPVLTVPVSLNNRRQVFVRFAAQDNITAVVEGFINFFEVNDEGVKLALLKRARYGMAPGTFLV